MKKIYKLTELLLSVFYPRLCIGCGNLLQKNETHLCLDCLLHLPETQVHLMDPNPLELIFRGRVPVENVFSFLQYRKGNHVQSILHQLKYKGNKEIGRSMGELYGKQLQSAGKLSDVDLILPIPLHPKNLKSRGYNQSEWIAKGLTAATHIPYRTDLLIRTTFTDTQTKKSRFNRWQNVKDVFGISDAQALQGKHVIVCDDVLTTGATMEAAISKILAVPDTRVSVVTLATAK